MHFVLAQSLSLSSATEKAYEEILKRIVGGTLPEGSPIKGSCLAEELGVSRTPVVQAIGRLVAEGLLEQQVNHRAVVAQGAGRWFHGIHEVRILLEPAAARVAASNLSEEQIDTLKSQAQMFDLELEPSSLREVAFQFDHALHNAIADASGNLFLRSIIRKCMGFKRFAYKVPNDPLERLSRSHQEHLEILRALEAGNVEMAAAAMSFHLQSTARELPDHQVI